MEEHHRRETAREIIPNGSRDRQPETRIRQAQGHEQHEQEHRPEDPQLLEIDRGDKVALLYRQEVKRVLRPVCQPLPNQPPSNRDLRLEQLIARALHVRRWIEEKMTIRCFW